MSHITRLEFECNSLKYLRRAVEVIDGLEFREGQTRHKYYADNYGDCHHAIGLSNNPKAYEIGVIDNQDGTFGFNWDTFNGGNGLVKVVGKDASLLKQEYRAQVGIAALRQKGFRTFKRTRNEQGKLIVEAEK